MNWKEYRSQFEFYLEEDKKTGRRKRSMRYVGPYYRFTTPVGERKAVQKWLWLYAALFLAGFVGAGFLSPPGAYVWWVVSFYLFSALPGFFAVLGVFRLGRVPERMTAIQKAETAGTIPKCAWWIIVLSALAALGSAVMLFMRWTWGKDLQEAAFLMMSLIRLGAGAGLVYWSKRLSWEEAA